jgi:predicted RNase H-like nuclease
MPGDAAALGIDLAWSANNPSGVCALSSDGHVVDEGTLVTDADLLQWIRVHSAASATLAVDAPLLVPNEDGRRPCENEVSAVYGSRHAGPHSANRALMTRVNGTIRGEDLAAELEPDGFGDPWSGRHRVMMEVFPHPALIEMFDLPRRLAYKKGRVAARRVELRELDRLLVSLAGADPPARFEPLGIDDTVRGRALKSTEDLLDARVCAWVALRWHRFGPSGVMIHGDPDTGHIAVPTGRRTPDS